MGCASSKADVVECEERRSTSLDELNIDNPSLSVREEPMDTNLQNPNVAVAIPDISEKSSVPPPNETFSSRYDLPISPVQCPVEMASLERIPSLSQPEEIVSSKSDKDQKIPRVEHNDKFASESEFADVTDQDSEHHSNYSKSSSVPSNPISPFDSPERPNRTYQVDNSFWTLSKQDKIDALNSSLNDFSILSQQAESSADLVALLSTLYSVVVMETDAYGRELLESESTPVVLHNFYYLMNQHASELSFVSILYSSRNNPDCTILATRLLLFYYINCENLNNDVTRLIEHDGTCMLLSVLQFFFDQQDSLHSNICDLFALLFYLSQDGESFFFCGT